MWSKAQGITNSVREALEEGYLSAWRCGFAAGCEAGLRPAVLLRIWFRLSPRFGLCPNLMGQRPNQGPSPKSFESLSGEA